MTYRFIWEAYIEPTLEAQQEVKPVAGATSMPATPTPPNREPTLEETEAAAIAAAVMFGERDLEKVRKAVRESYGKKRRPGNAKGSNTSGSQGT